MCWPIKYDHLKRIASCAFIILMMLVGCTIQNKKNVNNVSFDTLCQLSRSEFKNMNMEEVDQWIRKTHDSNIDISTKQMGDNQKSVTIYKWNESGSNSSAYLMDNHLVQISTFDNIEKGLTFGQVVSSLGPPDTVYGDAETYEEVLYFIHLDYPRLGISVGTSDFMKISDVIHGSEWAIQLKESMKVSYISCYKPSNSMEQVLKDVFFSAPMSLQIQLQHRIPWPGFGGWIPIKVQ